MAVLPTNYLDDILAASMGGKRRFRITHEDGSTEEVTLEDVSEYEQVGSPFGSGDVNKTNQAINEKLDSADVVDPALATVLGFAADAKLTGDALSELNKNFPFKTWLRRVKLNETIEGSVTIPYDEEGCDISNTNLLTYTIIYSDREQHLTNTTEGLIDVHLRKNDIIIYSKDNLVLGRYVSLFFLSNT